MLIATKRALPMSVVAAHDEVSAAYRKIHPELHRNVGRSPTLDREHRTALWTAGPIDNAYEPAAPYHAPTTLLLGPGTYFVPVQRTERTFHWLAPVDIPSSSRTSECSQL